jgi:hypothetical protein
MDTFQSEFINDTEDQPVIASEARQSHPCVIASKARQSLRKNKFFYEIATSLRSSQ